MIPKDTVDKIFETLKIEEVISDFVSLKKKGVNYIGNCPFHNEKTPSFTVSPTKGIYKCFGCGVGGNAVKFIMDIEHYSYPDALKYIAKKYNIEVVEKELTNKQKEIQNEKESLYIISKFASEFFKKSLLDSKEGKLIGLSYFEERGYNKKIIEKFDLGFSSKIKDDFSKHALKSGFDHNVLVNSGLGIKASSSSYLDRFAERVIFPIHSFSGRVLGFGGRALSSGVKAKYLNSPESLIYHKSKILYGLYQSKSEIAKLKNCFIVEGYTDVISMHAKDIKNVVSASGTALSIDQLKLIARITKNITLMFDGDEAGIKATYRTIDLALELEMNVKIITFPSNEDPDSFCKNHNSSYFKNFLEKNALDFVDYKIKISNLNKLNSPKEIIEVKRNIFDSIAMIPDSLIRSQYCKVYFKKLDVEEELMLQEVFKARNKIIKEKKSKKLNVSKYDDSKKEEKKENKKPKIINEKLNSPEKEIIRLLLNYGNEKFVYNNETITVSEMIINDLSADKIDIINEDYRDLYEKIKTHLKENKKIILSYFTNDTSSDSKIAIDLISSPHSISENWEERHSIYTTRENEKMRKTTVKAILSLKKVHVDVKISKIQMKLAENKYDENDVIELSSLTKIKNNISRTLGRNVG